jgi:hypothetical protein
MTPRKALGHPHKAPDDVKRIFRKIEDKQERYELNLYVAGEEEGADTPLGEPAGVEGTAAQSTGGHLPEERSPNR